jgi:hypothetical protein
MEIANVNRGYAVIAKTEREDLLECPSPAEGLPWKDTAESLDSEEGGLVWEGRVFAVAIVWILSGVLFGAIVCVFLPSEFLIGSLVSGGSLGALAGGLLEAGYLD